MKNIQPTICKHLPLEALSQTPVKHNPLKSRSKQEITIIIFPQYRIYIKYSSTKKSGKKIE